MPGHSRLLPTFSSMKFSVARFMLRSLINLELSSMHGDRYEPICILLHIDIQLCQHHLLKVPSFFPPYHFSFFVRYQVFISVWLSISL